MTRGEIWKDFLKHTVLTLVIALFLFLIFKSVFTKNGETETVRLPRSKQYVSKNLSKSLRVSFYPSILCCK